LPGGTCGFRRPGQSDSGRGDHLLTESAPRACDTRNIIDSRCKLTEGFDGVAAKAKGEDPQSTSSVEVASHEVGGGDFLEFGCLSGTLRHHERAAGVEVTAAGRVEGTGHLTG